MQSGQDPKSAATFSPPVETKNGTRYVPDDVHAATGVRKHSSFFPWREKEAGSATVVESEHNGPAMSLKRNPEDVS